MPRLNEHTHSLLTSDVLEKLFQKAIYSTIRFVQTDPELLCKITGLMYAEVSKIRKHILNQFSSKVTIGDKFYNEILTQCAIISTGIKSLDGLLDGGFVTGNIYELCGVSASGKTQLCMTISVNICVSSEKKQILYIDTKNDIYAHRLKQIIENHSQKVTDVNSIMEKIKIYQVRSAYELLSLLTKLSEDMKGFREKNPGLRTIIIDSLSAIFYQFHGEKHDEGLCLLNNIASVLHYITVEYHMAVLTTNLITTWIGSNDPNESTDEMDIAQPIEQPALGKYWTHIPATRISVKRLSYSNDCLLTIIKSTNQPIGKAIKCSIDDSGVK